MTTLVEINKNYIYDKILLMKINKLQVSLQTSSKFSLQVATLVGLLTRRNNYIYPYMCCTEEYKIADFSEFFTGFKMWIWEQEEVKILG